LLAAQQGRTPPARFLSISDILFDPGDLREIEAIYGPYLSDGDLYDYVIAVKQKEILAPNLPLAWRIPAMDGFDGGILPLRDYTRFTALFLPEDAISPDGRLRENLHAVPDWYWLSLANVRYVITDKVYDAWIDGVYYDLQFPARQHGDPSLPAPPPIDARPPQPFQATAVGIVGHLEEAANVPDGAQIGSVAIYWEGMQTPLDAIVLPLIVGRDFAEGEPAAAQHSTPEVAGYFTADQPELAEYRALVEWGGTPLTVERVEVSAVSGFPGTLVVRGMTLVDGRSGAFLPMRLSPDVHLIQSGDVKIYDYAAALPRAYVVCDPILAADEVEMWVRMHDSRRPVILDPHPIVGPPCDPQHPGAATITVYQPERVSIQVESRGMGAYLILSDAWYPGWTATVDGEPAEVLRANGMFRAVRLPLSSGEVVFEYRGRTLQIGAAISGFFSLLVLGGFAVLRRATP
jgi:hypothetical protein